MNEYFNSAVENNNNGDGNWLPKDNHHTTAGSEPVKAPETPVKKTSSAHNFGELTGPECSKPISVTHNLLTLPTAIDEFINGKETANHEEFHYIGRVSNSALKVNHATIGNGANHNDTPDINSGPGVTSSNVLTGNSTTPTSGSSDDFGGLCNGSVPTDSLTSNVLFGPDLQKALFTNGEASADPKLPGSDNATSGPILGDIQSAHATPAIAEEQVIVPTTPQRPPPNPDRLVYFPMNSPPASPNRYDGPANHSSMPPKPDTPLADQLRAKFWDRYCKEIRLFAAYKRAFKAWTDFTTTESNESNSDYVSTAEQLKDTAITAQVAWTENHIPFENWKASNPALTPIIANMYEDNKAVRAGEKQAAEREELVKELQEKPEKVRKSELEQYDNFTYLMKQSRQREMWSSRVEALVNAQAIIEEEVRRQDFIAEQQLLAALEAERQRDEAEAQAKAAAKRQEKEAEAEKQRKAAEFQAAEEKRLRDEFDAAMAAHAAEEERVKNEARAAEAQRETQRLADQRLVCEDLGIPEDPQLHNAVMCDMAGNLIDGVAAAEAAVFPDNTNSDNVNASQMHPGNDQAVQF